MCVSAIKFVKLVTAETENLHTQLIKTSFLYKWKKILKIIQETPTESLSQCGIDSRTRDWKKMKVHFLRSGVDPFSIQELAYMYMGLWVHKCLSAHKRLTEWEEGRILEIILNHTNEETTSVGHGESLVSTFSDPTHTSFA